MPSWLTDTHTQTDRHLLTSYIIILAMLLENAVGALVLCQ